MSEFSCFKCGDGNTPLYCLNCATLLNNAELVDMRDERDQEKARADKAEANLTADCQTQIMQLAAISTAAYQNTPSTVKDRIDEDSPYWTVAYGDVCRAVDREIAQRERADKAEAELEACRTSLQLLETGKYGRNEYADRAAKAEAACAEIRRLLEDWVHDNGVASVEWAKQIKHALSTSCGTGWMSPEVAQKVREALEGVLNSAVHPDKAIRSVMVPLGPIREALALLDK